MVAALTSFLHEGEQIIEEFFSVGIRWHVVQLQTETTHRTSSRKSFS